MLPKWILMRADRSESEFYYPEEQTLNQMTPINLLPNFKKKKYKKKINMLFTELGRSVWEKTVLKTSGTVFSHLDLPPGK